LCKRFDIEAVAIGNGTAGRETESFIRGLGLPGEITVVMVNESGASIYSASEAAREEFPDHDVTVRGSVSIGRRLMDPLAELVKIDPKSIGVGQYQHDVDQPALKKSLDDVVISSVNKVGVEVNTASRPAKPGRNPREQFEMFGFAEGVAKIEDVKPGMKLPGIITNITAFGAFVDIGVHQDGLVHISELSDRFVKNPGDVVKVHQKVMVTVLEVDLQRKRISLSLRSGSTEKQKTESRESPKSSEVQRRKSAKDKSEKARTKPDRNKPSRFANNPFYEAFKKIKD